MKESRNPFLSALLLLSLLSWTVGGQTEQANSPDRQNAHQDRIATLLERVGQSVQKYYDDLLSIVCTETVRQQELQPDLTPNGSARELVYEFLVVQPTSAKGQASGIRERRDIKLIDGKPVGKKNKPIWSDPGTAYTGFLSLLLPENQGSYTFSYAGQVELNGQKAIVLDYAPVTYQAPDVEWKGARFRLIPQGPWTRGRIWIDEDTYEVLQLESHLVEPIESRSPRVTRSGLFVRFGPSKKLRFEQWDLTIRFRPTSFPSPEQTLLLPERVETLRVIQGSRRPRVRTIHSFADYKRFTGEIKITS